MIFKDKLDEKTIIIRPEINKLLDIAMQKQSHIGDLLLVHINGFYQEEILQYNIHAENKLDPHVIGPGTEGHSEHTHNSFIHKYKTKYIHLMKHEEYIKQFVMEKWNKEISDRNTDLIEIEETTIQLEMLIYLKFWESDMIIKKLYQFVRALNGEPYDWYFKVAESTRHKNCTGTRQFIILQLIRDKINAHSPILYKIIKETYKTQIRNSIAHSNYSFHGRNIHLNNYIKEDQHSQIGTIPFDEWVDIFHNTLILHNEYIRINNLINDHYANIAFEYDNTMEFLVSEKNVKQYSRYVKYRPEWKDWIYKEDD